MNKIDLKRVGTKARAFLETESSIHVDLMFAGPELLDALCTGHSLRSVAKAAKLSPSYISMVRSSQKVICAETYLRLLEILTQR